ncbi:MAG: hypothetical protein KAI24_25665, partial [Planctomycetes bacterium]|nr:hypothetical protein [Planctomycetota bacterium]
MPRRSATFTTFHIALLAAMTGCEGAPQPLDLAPLAPTIEHLRAEHAQGDGAPQRFAVAWHATRDVPSGPAISRTAAAIVRDRGAPFRGASRLPIGTRWLDADGVARWLAAAGRGDPLREQLLATAETVLAPRVATVLRAAAPALPDVQLYFARQPGRIDALLDLAADAAGAREVAIVEGALTAATPAALFVPTPELAPGGLLVTITPQGPASTEAAQAAAAAADARTAAPAAPMSPRANAWQVARAAIGARNRRPALLALTTPLQLERVVDVLVVADERALIDATGPMTAGDPDAPDVAWQLERGLWQALLPRLER